MTTKQKERKSAQEHIHDLHKKHYAKKKVAKETLVTIEGEYPVSCQEYAKTTDAFPDAHTLARITRDLKKELPKKAQLHEIRFKETDSGNLSHAVAYFYVKITANEKQLLSIIGPNKLIVPNNMEVMKTQKKKPADVAPRATKTTGVGIDDQGKKQTEGNGKVTRKDLMKQAQGLGIKYFRILHREELEEVLKLHKAGESIGLIRIADIQAIAKKRWKAGWSNSSSLKNKEAKTPAKKK